jgi:hypothetical protein
MAQRRLFDPETGELIDEQPDIVAAEEQMDVDDMTATPETQQFRFQQNALSGQATGAAGGIDTRVPIARSPALAGMAPSVDPGMWHQDRLPVREAILAKGNIGQYKGLEGFADIARPNTLRGREAIAGLSGFEGDTYKTGLFDMMKIGQGMGMEEDEIQALMNYEKGGGAEGKMFHGLMELSGASGKGWKIEGASGKQKSLDLDIDDPRHMAEVKDFGERSMRRPRVIEGRMNERTGEMMPDRHISGGPSKIGGDSKSLFYQQRNIDRTFRKAGRVSGNEIGMDMIVKGIAIAGLAAMTGGALGPVLAGVIGPALMGASGFAAGGLGASIIGGASAGLVGGAAGGFASSAMSGFEGGLSGTLKNIGMGAGMGMVGGGLMGGLSGGGTLSFQAPGTANRAMLTSGQLAGIGGAGASGAGSAGSNFIMTPAGPMSVAPTGAGTASLTGITSANAAALGYSGIGGGAGGMSAGQGVSGARSQASFIDQAGNIASKFGESAKIAGQGIGSAAQEAGARGAAVQAQLQEAQSTGAAAQAQSAQARAAGLASNIRAKSNIFQDNPFYDPIEDFETGQVGVV